MLDNWVLLLIVKVQGRSNGGVETWVLRKNRDPPQHIPSD